ncbi:MAG TPA: hypothetical protein VKH37_03480, partial [Ferruginibacter sp.]|nr:hypothetical protein [Ferruginibacter sp.]
NLRDFVQGLFKEGEHLPIVPKAEQQQEIELLKQTLGSERFFFVIDLKEFEIVRSEGINRWLGYPDGQLKLDDYWETIVHPQCKKSTLLIAQQLYGSLCSGMYPLQFMVQRYSTRIALKHRDGHYVLVKKTSSVFQYDRTNHLLEYLNEFTIIGDYNGEPIEPRMFNSFGDRENEREKEILERTMKNFLDMKVFSAKELQTARKLAYEQNATQNSIAEEFNVSKHTVDTYYRRFLEKARNFFGTEFQSATAAATFLKKEGLL